MYIIFPILVGFPYESLSIEILSNGGKTIKKISNINLNSIKYIYEQEINEKESWYVIKINEEGNRIAISSPIFLKK